MTRLYRMRYVICILSFSVLACRVPVLPVVTVTPTTTAYEYTPHPPTPGMEESILPTTEKKWMPAWEADKP